MSLAQPLLQPRSVAIVGASDDPAKTTGRPLRFLRASGYLGNVYPVNPNRVTVQGERAWPSIDALPEVPDHAYIVTPTSFAIEAVAACARNGVKVATILAAGFSEAGEAGARREAQLRRVVEETGIRVVGPSSLGVVSLRNRLLLTANAAFAEPGLVPGGIFVASQSGTMIGALLSRGKARGVSFAGFVSVGNEVDLGVGEICASTLDDPGVKGYLLFLETLRKAGEIRDFALAAHARGKAVVAYKLGRSEAAADLAVTHTGALAGEDDVADAFFRDCGIARVHTLDGLIEALPLVGRCQPSRRASAPARVGVVTTTGGGAAMVVDPLGVRGVNVQAPGAETLARLAQRGIEVAPGRIVDLTLAGTNYAVMKGALEVLLEAPEFDLVVAVAGSSARFEPERAVRPIIDSAAAAKPLAAFVVPDAPEALARLTEAGVPNFRTPEACADAIAAAFSRRVPVGNPGRTWNSGSFAKTNSRSVPGFEVDELRGYAVLAGLGIPHAAVEAVDASRPVTSLRFPVAVKVLSPDIAHKTEAGGVALGVADERALVEAVVEMRERLRATRPQAAFERVLIQEMARGLGEALVGYRIDPQVGPLVMLAAGGVLAEIHRDRAIRLAPVDVQAAREMVGEIKAFAALAGFRGLPRGDLEALARAVAALSQLAVIADPAVIEAEVNPMIIRAEGEGVVAVDALVRLA
ncbi:MAG TPA: acetate--CoA ligase family protein [Usitatibacter sp.]|nr:acetate--CoA ligase family protein [Usitatibacter sp.]